MFKFSDKNRDMCVYSFSGATGEYLGVANISVPANTGLPEFTTSIQPGEPKLGHVFVFNVGSQIWDETPNYRGKLAYRKQDGQEVTIFNLGPLSEHFTFDKPTSTFDKWTETGWIKDDSAELAYIRAVNTTKKKQLLAEVFEQISILSDAVEVDEATDEEIARLKLLKSYRLALNRIDTSEREISWPDKP